MLNRIRFKIKYLYSNIEHTWCRTEYVFRNFFMPKIDDQQIYFFCIQNFNAPFHLRCDDKSTNESSQLIFICSLHLEFHSGRKNINRSNTDMSRLVDETTAGIRFSRYVKIFKVNIYVFQRKRKEIRRRLRVLFHELLNKITSNADWRDFYPSG